MEEVLVARTTSGRQIWSRALNSSFFRSSSSKIASITKSASPKGASSVTGVIRPSVACRSSSVSFPLLIARCMRPSMVAIAFSTLAISRSRRITL